jgi:hypothetical protein
MEWAPLNRVASLYVSRSSILWSESPNTGRLRRGLKAKPLTLDLSSSVCEQNPANGTTASAAL